MAIIKTGIGIEHLELIKIFFKANELKFVIVEEHIKMIREQAHTCIQLAWSDTDTETGEKITFMAMRHLGIQNMLDDYLMKCGVTVFSIPPASIAIQENKERIAEKDKEFDEHFNKRKQSV